MITNQSNSLTEIKDEITQILSRLDATKEQHFLRAPSNQELSSISNVVSSDIDAENWLVFDLVASDNLVNRSFRRWHLNILKRMQKQSVGIPVLVNHNWENIDASVGFVIKSVLSRDDDKLTYQKSGYEKLNKKILAKEGYTPLVLTVALPKITKNNELVDSIEHGLINACSTGGEISQVRLICPNCSETHGREVTFTELDAKGKYVCPHYIPSNYSLYYAEEEDTEYKVADYAIYDGLYENLELSLVNIGNLPNARIIR